MNQPTIFHHGTLQAASDNDILKGTVIYEVIRIIDGKPLFLVAHLQRLLHSAAMRLSYPPDTAAITKGIHAVVADNHLEIGNIEIQMNDSEELLIKIIPHSYPAASMYDEGIRLGLLLAERDHPNAKEKNQTLRDRANTLIRENNYFEVLLVDHQENITEGSRSNIFFIKGDQVYTSPTATVLQGVTRETIMAICREQQIPIHETAIPCQQLDSYDAAFLTGTSPSVLPVQKIENYSFSPKNVWTETIRNAYKQWVANDLNNFSW